RICQFVLIRVCR
nr:Chain A, Capra hircus Cathelicidin-1 (dodecylphosphocholine) [Capra hircus]7ACB_B Chain B, Capra hircus Cathelicidin-1 (dodecylphosphocholine) [Capra hircus]7ACB_C Chain C, Capra hircus Cathelicidin-1 (dodecylphosphocholine) [Capra hircus]7ACB_D Chain D, Capra hircus Cathelicidin-1 (dodecylphosphocholine) [Capra hircus]7ACE_A Chain A, Capra hircus Cathelicidin-1 [Capra hircus]7ACE_B Chain B, Capra hircus Cathelicidin-1 [Capra hircus]